MRFDRKRIFESLIPVYLLCIVLAAVLFAYTQIDQVSWRDGALLLSLVSSCSAVLLSAWISIAATGRFNLKFSDALYTRHDVATKLVVYSVTATVPSLTFGILVCGGFFNSFMSLMFPLLVALIFIVVQVKSDLHKYHYQDVMLIYRSPKGGQKYVEFHLPMETNFMMAYTAKRECIAMITPILTRLISTGLGNVSNETDRVQIQSHLLSPKKVIAITDLVGEQYPDWTVKEVYKARHWVSCIVSVSLSAVFFKWILAVPQNVMIMERVKSGER